MKGAAITFENVSKSYPLYHHLTGGMKNFIFHLPEALRARKRRFEALKGISFEVREGECFGVIGRNGAGKSTTLALMAGVIKPTSGRVVVSGRVSPLLALGSGFHPDLTGRENILLNGVLLGMTRADVRARLEEIVEFSELGGFIDQPVRTYSSGMYARLGFSVVAHLDPEILLIDEILAVGDMAFQKKCFTKMLDFKKRGVTMVLVTHSLDNVETLCDRAMWIDERRVRMIGSPGDVIEEYSHFRPAARKNKVIDYRQLKKSRKG